MLSIVWRMEKCTSDLIELFQDFDALSLFSQLLLEDMSLKRKFNWSKNERLIILIDQLCDWALKSLKDFLENRKLQKKTSKCKVPWGLCLPTMHMYAHDACYDYDAYLSEGTHSILGVRCSSHCTIPLRH